MTIRVGSDIIAGLSSDQLATKANLNLDNSTVITNCITEIPQDIKLELNSGTLTLKAGSKLYVPNGFESDGTTPKFDVVTIASDFSYTDTQQYDYRYFTFYNKTTDAFFPLYEGVLFSGYTQPVGYPTCMWYDTTNNIIKCTFDGFTTYTECSLPLCIYQQSSSGVTVRIDKILNGFGRIGSTIYALPGVKGLIPNGRNIDGSFKNIEFTIDSVKTATRTWNKAVGEDQFIAFNYVPIAGISMWFYNNYIESKTIPSIVDYTMWYNPETNIIKYNDGDSDTGWIEVKSTKLFVCGSDGTTRVNDIYNVKQVFHALDWSDSSTVSGWAMPSNKYIDLTLGASGTEYTAPANGWFCINYNMTSNTSYAGLNIDGYAFVINGTTQYNAPFMFPCKKGGKIKLNYANAVVSLFRFYYAQGEV